MGIGVSVVGWLGHDSVEKEQVYSMRMTSQPNLNCVIQLSLGEPCTKMRGRVGLPFRRNLILIRCLEWAWGQLQPMEPGPQTEEPVLKWEVEN